MVAERDYRRARVGAGGGRRGSRMSETRQPDEPSFTEDRLLGGRIRLRQPATGYRVAIDPVFLAASVPAEPHQLVLDVGCGAGAAMLCLAARVPHSPRRRARNAARSRPARRRQCDPERAGSARVGDDRRSAAAAAAARPRARSTTSWPTRPSSSAAAAAAAATAGKVRGDDRRRRRSRRLGALLARDGPGQGHGDLHPPRRPDRRAARPYRRPGRRGRGVSVVAGAGQGGEPHPGSRAQAGRRPGAARRRPRLARARRPVHRPACGRECCARAGGSISDPRWLAAGRSNPHLGSA